MWKVDLRVSNFIQRYMLYTVRNSAVESILHQAKDNINNLVGDSVYGSVSNSVYIKVFEYDYTRN